MMGLALAQPSIGRRLKREGFPAPLLREKILEI
jgi:hypothetical protein